MTINEKQIEYYRSKIIGKYTNPIMKQYANEEIEYNAEIERVNRMLKMTQKRTR